MNRSKVRIKMILKYKLKKKSLLKKELSVIQKRVFRVRIKIISKYMRRRLGKSNKLQSTNRSILFSKLFEFHDIKANKRS